MQYKAAVRVGCLNSLTMKKNVFGFVTIFLAAIVAGMLMNRREKGGCEDNDSQDDEELYNI